MNRETALVGTAILALAAIAWVLSALNVGPMVGMPMLPLDAIPVALFTVAWTLGMVAMMFPTVVPMMLMFVRMGKGSSPEIREGGGPTPAKAFIFVATYLGLWVGAGLLFYFGAAVAFSQLPVAANAFIGTSLGLGVALIIVAAYQLSPIKGECLARCHPTQFLFRYYKGGLFGAARMGGDYARYCIGCCWVMMVFLLVSASMGLLWMAAFAGIIFVERTFPMKKWAPKLFGAGFLLSGLLLVLAA